MSTVNYRGSSFFSTSVNGDKQVLTEVVSRRAERAELFGKQGDNWSISTIDVKHYDLLSSRGTKIVLHFTEDDGTLRYVAVYDSSLLTQQTLAFSSHEYYLLEIGYMYHEEGNRGIIKC